MTTTRRIFTDEFKQEAVALLVSSGRSLAQIARELGLQPSVLRKWQRRLIRCPFCRGKVRCLFRHDNPSLSRNGIARKPGAVHSPTGGAGGPAVREWAVTVHLR